MDRGRMDSYLKLLLGNKAWVQDRMTAKPDYFAKSVEGQQPEFLWIGCSDSRVPAEDVTGAEPGELFVHRNIANLVVHTDVNLLSVLQYAVQVLKVKHVIVCGHYNCGGIKTAMAHQDLGMINTWLRHIKDVYRQHCTELEALDSEQARWDRLVELTVAEQLQNLARTAIIQNSWHSGNSPSLHGWVYDLRSGYIKEIAHLKPRAKLDDIYTFNLE
ncbi:MAG: carbonic anhydrase [Bryobacteraceae bacterium]